MKWPATSTTVRVGFVRLSGASRAPTLRAFWWLTALSAAWSEEKAPESDTGAKYLPSTRSGTARGPRWNARLRYERTRGSVDDLLAIIPSNKVGPV